MNIRTQPRYDLYWQRLFVDVVVLDAKRSFQEFVIIQTARFLTALSKKVNF